MSVTSSELNYKILAFDLYRKKEAKLFNEKMWLQEKFVKDFSPNRILQLKLDEYIQGKGSKKSFCYRLETGLIKLGNMKGATSHKFGIYYGKEGEDKDHKYRFTKRYGSTKEEVLKNVKMNIFDLLKAGKIDDREKIIKNKLAPLIRYKLLATYFPNAFINIYAEEHVDFFLSELGLNVSSDEMYDKQKALLEFKKQNKILAIWSNNEFNSFLYYTFGKPPSNEKEKIILETLPPIEKVKAEFLNYKIMRNKSNSNAKSKSKYKPDYEGQNDRNNRLGMRGENIVFNIEKEFIKKNHLSQNKLEHVSVNNDRLGYDIVSLDEKGNQKYIEVKSTRSKPDLANFIITSNEKEKATSLNNYFIYIVFEANTLHPKIIQLKDPFNKHKNKMHITPVNYRVTFNIKST